MATTPVKYQKQDKCVSEFVKTQKHHGLLIPGHSILYEKTSGRNKFLLTKNKQDCSASTIPHSRPQGLDVAEGDV